MLAVAGGQADDLQRRASRVGRTQDGVGVIEQVALEDVSRADGEDVEAGEDQQAPQRRPARPRQTGPVARHRQSALRMLSTIFLASPNSIMVLSRKKSSFSTPA